MTAAVLHPQLTPGYDHHPVADHHRHQAVPLRGGTGQKPAGGLVDA
jgi:hypothetical protein